jgi:cytochrome P450
MELLDLSDPDSFGDGFPHEMFRALRRENPVVWHEGDIHGGPGYWIISKYEDIRQISRSPKAFSSAFGTNIQDREDRGSASEGGLEAPVLLDMDPPHHVRYRKLVSSGFTPRQIAGLEADSREIVRTIIDDVSAKGGCDFVTDIAAELPLQVIARLLGCPAEDRYKIFEWSNCMIGGEDPEYMPEEGAQLSAAAQMFMYANGLAEDRLKTPRNDLMSTILHGEVDGERISMAEFDAFFLILAIAGNETTRNLIAHGMLQLIEHPEARARLIAEPELMPSAVEEMLRYCAPVMYFRRTAVEDIEIRGQKIRAHTQPPPGLRGRRALLPRNAPGPPGDPRNVRAGPRALARHRARRRSELHALPLHRWGQAHPDQVHPRGTLEGRPRALSSRRRRPGPRDA